MPLDGSKVTTSRLWSTRDSWLPLLELALLVMLLAGGLTTYAVIGNRMDQGLPLSPPLVAVLLVANLVPAIALLVLLGRRLAKARAARSPIGGSGRLHVRLVAIFSLLASIPTLVVVVLASLLFQAGVQFWFSDRAKATIEGAASVVQDSYLREQDRITANTVIMAGDLGRELRAMPIDDRNFLGYVGGQLLQRELSEGLILRAAPGQDVQSLVLINPYERQLDRFIVPRMIAELRSGAQSVTVRSPGGIGTLTRLPYDRDLYLYAARITPEFGQQIQRADAVRADYRSLTLRARSLQLQFNAALIAITLLIVGAAVLIALRVADRLVRPIEDLVDATRRVTDGDLTTRVGDMGSKDEIATLGRTFNRMTERLENQTTALDRRRALTEAVLSGVSAGVVAVDGERKLRLANASAAELLGTTIEPGAALGQVAAELDTLLLSGERQGVAEMWVQGESRTLAVRVVRDELGHVITFDDITQQLSDQRRAAWADVARRIAHEIKNPLTPIQLAAERLQRRYGSQVQKNDGTFARLTETIVRQVGDLRRMVDEFSSFARMPKPVFRTENLTDLVREALFLQEVAHPALRFAITGSNISMVCDRRQIAQALTNLVKNAVEAIVQQAGGEAAGGTISATVTADDPVVAVIISDSGIGLPRDRERIVEPYVTNRPGGTGLGLAIVKKIVEEHLGTMTFSDREGGGSTVTLQFDRAALERMPRADADQTRDAA